MRLTLIPPARPRLARPKPMVQRFFQWLARRGPKKKKLLTLSITCCTEMIYLPIMPPLPRVLEEPIYLGKQTVKPIIKLIRRLV